MENEYMLKVKDLHIQYVTGDNTVYAVNGVTLNIKKGHTLGLVGETGAGKTTIAKAVMRLLPERTARITGGSIELDGVETLKLKKEEMEKIRGKTVSMVFQDPMSSLDPIERIGDQIKETLYYHNYAKRDSKAMDAKVDELLMMVGILPSRKYDYPHQFSGGMKQRAVIAIALACEPDLLIADEPTTALDVTIQAQVLELMRELKKEHNTSMLMITHDLGIVALLCDEVAVMYAGEVVEYGTLKDLYSGDRHHPYTEGLFAAVPSFSGEQKRLNAIPGLMADPTKQPAGCRFAERCPFATERCFQTHPEYYNDNGHLILCHRFAQTEGETNE